jgi:hypothetical protein
MDMSDLNVVIQGAGLVLLCLLLIGVVVLSIKLVRLSRSVRLSRDEVADNRVVEALVASGFTPEEAERAMRDSR